MDFLDIVAGTDWRIPIHMFPICDYFRIAEHPDMIGIVTGFVDAHHQVLVIQA
jgi:hypothetical protein